MVVASSSPLSMRNKKTRAVGVPTIDLMMSSSSSSKLLSERIVNACEEYGIFKVINHGISNDISLGLEKQGVEFFNKPTWEKKLAAAAAAGGGSSSSSSPFGYGCRDIGRNGDVGDLEYLLLHANPNIVEKQSKTISTNDPATFSKAVNDYVQSVRNLACDLLDLMAQGLWVQDKSIFSKFIRDVESDSLLRFNHYPPSLSSQPNNISYGSNNTNTTNTERIGFGAHTDPQILTILRSNDADGLQICTPHGLWLGVPPDPHGFYVMVGDTLQALTNGRFVSVKHRVLANSTKRRMSMVYFGAPPPNAKISPLQEMMSPQAPSLYKPFTWSEYKKVAYSTRLSDSRLDFFKHTFNTTTTPTTT